MENTMQTADRSWFNSMSENPKYRTKTMQTTATGQMSTLDHVLNVGLIFTGISVLVLVGILIFKKK